MGLYLHNQVQHKVGNRIAASIFYHDIFDYPLTESELKKWQAGKKIRIRNYELGIREKRGFSFVKGKEGNILKRLAREKASAKKLRIAKRAGRLLAKIPTVKMVGITGALAMRSSDPGSDIDLLIITSKGTLWMTRVITVCCLLIAGFKLRRAGVKEQKDKLCLNMWFDESSLVWRRRNIFTAHEIAQIIPLVNKNKTYEKFLLKNKWILDFWPKSVGIRNKESGIRESKVNTSIIHYSYFLIRFLEQTAFQLQYLYMKPKITRETVTKTRAVFHPFDWSKHIKARGF